MSAQPVPGTVGDVLGNAGVVVSLTYMGRPHPVSYPTPRVLDRVEKLVAQRASAAIAELADVLPPAEHQSAKDRFHELLLAKEHGTGGKLWVKEFEADGGLRGVLMMLWACLEEGRDISKDKAKLAPPIPFEDMATVLQESPDAQTAILMVLPDFIRAAGQRRKFPAAMIAEMESRIRESIPGASPAA